MGWRPKNRSLERALEERSSPVISLSWKDAADLKITCSRTAPLSSTLPHDTDWAPPARSNESNLPPTSGSAKGPLGSPPLALTKLLCCFTAKLLLQNFYCNLSLLPAAQKGSCCAPRADRLGLHPRGVLCLRRASMLPWGKAQKAPILHHIHPLSWHVRYPLVYPVRSALR